MKIIEITVDATSLKSVSAIAEKYKAYDFRMGSLGSDGRQTFHLVVDDNTVQPVLDATQGILGAQPYARILVLPVEVVLPKPSKEERPKRASISASREALLESVEKSVQLDADFIVLVAISTVVAAIGLIENSAAVVIGAMVIAPLLGPNLALGFSASLGDVPLMRRSIITLMVGIGIAVALSIAMGAFLSLNYRSTELLSRTLVGLDSVVLALASGAAASLSLTTGLSSVLVGVMVAVALLPPAVTAGLMLGHGDTALAAGAGLLLLVNVVCLNLASKVVFLIKGIRPRKWWEKEKANRVMRGYILVWVVTLLVLVILILSRRALPQ